MSAVPRNPIPDPPPSPYRPGETPLQCNIRDTFERLANFVKELPDTVDRRRSLDLIARACESAVVCAKGVK